MSACVNGKHNGVVACMFDEVSKKDSKEFNFNAGGVGRRRKCVATSLLGGEN